MGSGRAAVAWPLVAATLASACLGGAVGPRNPDEAPDGPDSLRVGSARWGEYARHFVTTTGTRIRLDLFGQQGTPEPFHDGRHEERTVSAAPQPAHDRFLDPLQVVAYAFRLTDEDPEGDAPAVQEYVRAYDLGSEQYVYLERPVRDAVYVTECQLVVTLCDDVRVTDTLLQTYYPRERPSARWGLLEGQVLKLGRTVSFERLIHASGVEYRLSLNYTALHEDQLDGHRVFAVEPRVRLQQVDPPLEPSPAPSNGTGAPQPLPEPLHLLWVGSHASVPVRELHREPFRWDGRVYWIQTESVLEAYEPGADPIVWGAAPETPAWARLPAAGRVPAPHLVHDAQDDLRYPLRQAWLALRNDPLLLDFQDYLQDFPDAWPYYAVFLPEAGRGAYTWRFVVGDHEHRPYLVETRRQFVADLPSAFVTQNRDAEGEDDGLYHQLRAPDPDLVNPLPLVPFEDALDLYDRLRPTDDATGVVVNLATFQGYRSTFRPEAHFFHADVDAEAASFRTHWNSRDPVSVSLVDGGFTGHNLTWSLVGGVTEWPWLPQPGLPFLDDRAPGLGGPSRDARPRILSPAEP